MGNADNLVRFVVLLKDGCVISFDFPLITTGSSDFQGVMREVQNCICAPEARKFPIVVLGFQIQFIPSFNPRLSIN